jgi:hypothetical protein
LRCYDITLSQGGIIGDDVPAMNRLFAEFFPSAPPTRATPIVGLPRGLRILIEATVFLG